MTRCQSCFNLERFCTCDGPVAPTADPLGLDAAPIRTAQEYWTEVVHQNARAPRPMLPIELKFQRIAVAAFN
jgi:hypothetical protein